MPATPLSRRSFLKSKGALLALPFLEAMRPAFGVEPEKKIRRMVAVQSNLGILARHFFPQNAGWDYGPTRYLETLRDVRGDFTVFSGLSHGEVSGGHAAEATFLTGASHPELPTFRNSISLDQFAAQFIGVHTRFQSLPLAVSRGGNASLSWTADGVRIPAEASASGVYKKLFIQGNKEDIRKQLEALKLGRSILDTLGGQAADLNRRIGAHDRERMDQYFTSVRELERRLHAAEEWEDKPKPNPPRGSPADGQYLIEKSEAMYEIARLAIETDSTRLVTIMMVLDGLPANLEGVSDECHNLSHHGNRPDKLRQLEALEEAQFRALAKFLKGLKSSGENGGKLLDNTLVLYGSPLGDGNNHSTRNLPILLAGGGFKHGQHLVFDAKHNAPLSNLFVSMLQDLGVEAGRFSNSTGTLQGLELK